jgi:Condensation domain
VTMHHIASDGWSSAVFFRELATFYNAMKAGVPPDLPPLRIQYIDFAEWQRQYLQGEYLEKLLSYWKHRIGTRLSSLRLKFPSTESQRKGARRHEGAHQVLNLSGSVSNAALPLYRSGRYPCRDTHSRAQIRRSRRCHRVLCQHTGTPYGPVG